MFLFNCYQTTTVGLFLNADADGILGQNVFYQFWPLNEAEGTRVEVVLIAHIIHLFEFLDSIEVEVVDRTLSLIFIHNGEGGRGDHILYTQFLTDGLDKGGLTSPHAAIEGEHMLIAHRVDKRSRCLANMLQIF